LVFEHLLLFTVSGLGFDQGIATPSARNDNKKPQ